jgi:predicted SnoaL-like aldol condensation-catalyzing enzyme
VVGGSGPAVTSGDLVGGQVEQAVNVVDIWRLEDGLIVEHWDVMQPA